MLRVESNTDIRGFTEFEEDIIFDKDDPDFDHQLPALPTFVIEVFENHVETMVHAYKTILGACKHLYFSSFQRTTFRLYHLSSFTFWIDPHELLSKIINSSKGGNSSKAERYWVKKTVSDLIAEADLLYQNGQYMDVYELLNRIKFNSNPEIQWRICRALFKMSSDETVKADVREEMIAEAYTLINLAMSLDTNNANVYKWMAIITDAKCNLDGLVTKIRAFGRIKVYIEKALELNPDDVVILYMLGKWSYEMARLTWFQRIIAGVLYDSPPRASYEEAYEYLHRAAELQNKDYYIPTFYVLGKTCIKLKQFFRARYYLHTAACLPPRTRYEETCAKKSKQLIAQMEKYDVDKECILSECPFSAEA